MADLAEGLQEWMKQVKNAELFPAVDRARITGAGATAYAEILKKNTPRSNRSYVKGRRAGRGKRINNGKVVGRQRMHVADAITFKPGWTTGGYLTGDTSVGWKDRYSEMVAHFVNDGAGNVSDKRIANMHFKDRSELEARDAVLRAEMKAYKEVMHQ